MSLIRITLRIDTPLTAEEVAERVEKYEYLFGGRVLDGGEVCEVTL